MGDSWGPKGEFFGSQAWNRIWHQGAAESYVKEANWNSQIFTWLDQIPDDLEVSQGWPFRWDDSDLGFQLQVRRGEKNSESQGGKKHPGKLI